MPPIQSYLSKMVLLDHGITQWFFVIRNDMVAQVFFWITQLGSWYVVTVLTFFSGITLWLDGKRRQCVFLFLAVGGTALLVFFVKIFFHRDRPSLAFLSEPTFSFPSGHAAIAVALYGGISYLFWRETKRLYTLFIGFFLIFLVGVSRLYLGVHYPTDVLGGYVIGGLWTFFAVWFTRQYHSHI